MVGTTPIRGKCKVKRMFLIFLLFMMASPFFAQSAEKLPSLVNTDNYDEVGPVLSPDGNTLYFSRLGYPQMVRTLIQDGVDVSVTLSRDEWKEEVGNIYSQLAGHEVNYPLRSVYNQDIWIAKMRSNGEVNSVELPSYPLNSALPNTVLSFWDDENKLILLNQFFSDGSMNEGLSLMPADNRKNLPKPLHIYNFYTLGSDVQASISPAGDVIILALQREDSHGNMDLYISFRSGNDIWSEPVNLGTELNTPHREGTPFLSKNNRILFFASDRPGGQGGMDIYMSERIGSEWDQWTTPKRLNTPVNSASHDSQPCFSPDNKFLYFTSMRDGSSDIYRYPIKLETNVPESKSVSNRLTVNVTIEDKETRRKLPANLKYQYISQPDETYLVEAKGGNCSFIVAQRDKIKFFIEKEGYKDANFIFNAAPLMNRGLEEASLKLPLEKAAVQQVYAEGFEDIVEEEPKTTGNQMLHVPEYKKKMMKEGEKMVESYILDNILFKRQTPVILSSSYPSLDKLVETMQSKPSVNIIIEGHTDNGLENNVEVGNPADRKQKLLALSKKRASAVKDYLVKKNIEPSRIRTVGLGDKHPLNDNSNAMERRLNRRVEILIVE